MVIIRKQIPRKKKNVKKKLTKGVVSPKTTKRKISPLKSSLSLSVIDRITPIGFSEDDGIKILIYGKSGTGKTTLWSTFPRPILAIICSGSQRPGELRSIDIPENRKSIEHVILEKSSEIREVVEYQQQTEKYATIVLDHVTSLQDHILAEILGLEEIPEQLSWGIATVQNWGQVGIQLKEALRLLLNLKCRVAIVAHEREFNVDSDEALILPSVSSALTAGNSRWLHGVIDYVVQTRIQPKMKTTRVRVGEKVSEKQVRDRGVNYVLRTGPDAVYDSKFRVPIGTKLPDEIVNPTYDKIMEIIKGARV